MCNLLHLRTAHFQNHRVRFHARPRPDIYFFHAALGVCRNPANVFRDEGAEPAHLSHHWTAFDGIDPNGRPIDARHCWFQARNCNCCQDQPEHGPADDHDAALALFRRNAGTRNVHRGKTRRKARWAHNPLICWFSFWNHGFAWGQNRGGRVLNSWSIADIPAAMGTTAMAMMSVVNTAASLMNSRSASPSK